MVPLYLRLFHPPLSSAIHLFVPITFQVVFRDSYTGEGEGGRRIADFRAELEQTKLVSHFRTPDHLAGLVSVAVQQCAAEKPQIQPKPHSRVLEIKRQTLQQRLDNLLKDYQTATEQLAYTLSAVDQTRLKRQIDVLEQEMERVETALSSVESTKED